LQGCHWPANGTGQPLTASFYQSRLETDLITMACELEAFSPSELEPICGT
jgi:hypothetical protein